MTAHAQTTELRPDIRSHRQVLRRAALMMLLPLAVYGIATQFVSSSALALGIAGAVPVGYSIVLAVAQHRIDPVALLSAIGFSLACVVSVLAGGSSLPLKLQEAAITFSLGLLMLVAVLVGRPLPVAKRLRVPGQTKAIDRVLGALIGGFLVLHALVHLALAVYLTTSSYVIVSRLVNWGTLALGALALSAYVRYLRARAGEVEHEHEHVES
jgi:hypothetical protein